MVNLLLVFFGGGVGSVCRYLFGVGYVRAFGPGQAYMATFGINVLGGVLMGLLVGLLALRGGGGLNQEKLRLLLAVGILGGFTTFSSYSLDAVLMFERKAYGPMAGYVCGSVVLSILGLMAGLLVMRKALA